MSVVARRPSEAGTGATAAAAVATGQTGRRTGFRVPWGTVVPLAVVLAFADSFWVVALRGAVGAVERTQQPFGSWWRDSLLAVPLATLAVLLALAVARRLVGPTRRRFGFLMTWLLVAGFGTVAGMIQLSSSAVYDYVLQTRNNSMMLSTSGGMCSTAQCLERMQHATLALQLKALGYGAVLILVTSLVVTFLVIALRGRLDLVGSRRTTSRLRMPRLAQEPGGQDLVTPDTRLLLAAALLGAAVIHAAVVPEHLTEWPAAGVFFVALCLVEAALAGALLRSPGRFTRSTQLLLVVVASGAPLLVWAWSRVLGLPFGPTAGAREAVGAADVVASLLELGTLLLVLGCQRAGSRLRLLPPFQPTGRAAGLLAVAALTATALQTLGLGFGPM